MGAPLDQATKLTERIIDECQKIKGLGPRDLIKGDEFGLPRLIPDGNGQTVQINKAIDEQISEVARVLMQARGANTKNVRDEEWRLWVRSAIGPALMQIQSSETREVAAAGVVSRVDAELDVLLSGLPACEYAFGTTLFASSDMARFTIGPVVFERREDWLSRKLADGSISQIMYRRILRAWSGARLPRRKETIDHLRERGILETLGPCPVVCTVQVVGHSAEAGRELALSATRLGLTCISLIWDRPSRVLDGFNLRYDRGMYRESTLRFVPGKFALPGSRIRGRKHGPHMSSGDWATELATHSAFFTASAEVIEYLLSADGQVTRPLLMNALLQSLLWFYEGCREENDLLAIVNFAAALDALGGGKKAKAILQVLEARVGVLASSPVYAGGPTLKGVIDTIYSDGRSRAIHGTSDKIGHDWTQTRGIAEVLARHALFASIEWVGANPRVSDDPELLKK
ncbi:hypothetical protein QA635_19590 [Bradyrhizobium brasilense]|uniref:hypothetical protein n=1 Tax=Bradyrhizobium brasilense TaxID=1419277 RepID=UPI0024B1DEC5|nr:hypothetical protein [Bradyrhizobium australafricanum]WFU36496.1 hypothetical protein QA635_19590 [Bradyrhizobium australafricanum]